MTDQELLRLAAKAAGLKPHEQFCTPAWDHVHRGGLVVFNDKGGDQPWRPLDDDGDALRLAADLGICLRFTAEYEVYADPHNGMVYPEAYADYDGDRRASTRRAIVRAAAEIGKQMP